MESKSAERPASSKVSSFTPFYRIENDIDYMDKIEQTKPTKEYVEASMKYVEEKIAKTTANGSWKGVDVDEFLDEMRGREPDDDDLAKEINAIHERYPEISFAKLSRICARIANWKEEQMMKNAITCNVFWFDRVTIAYPWEQEKEALKKIGVKEGDVIKVIIIKDERYKSNIQH